MNTRTEKAVRAICHELADKMAEAANKHGKERVNVCVSITTRVDLVVNSKFSTDYHFRLTISTPTFYDIFLESIPMHVNGYDGKGHPIPMNERLRMMARDIYANHGTMIGLMHDTFK